MDNPNHAEDEKPLDETRLATQVTLWSYETYDDEPSESYQNLLDRLNRRQAVIGIIGLGVVGLPLAVAFAEAGFKVVGVDADPAKVAALEQAHLSDEGLHPPETRLRASTSETALREADVVCICVPTPMLKTEASDLPLVIQAIDQVVSICHDNMLIVFESTTAPGTAVQLLVPKLRNRGLEVGKAVFVACAPSRTDATIPQYRLRSIPKIVGGITPMGTELVTALYQTIFNQVIPVSDATTAETVKLLETSFQAVSEALVNELAQMCGWLGVQIWEVIKAASSRPVEFSPPYAGMGGVQRSRLIDLASEINLSMPKYVLETIMIALNDEAKAVRNARILVLGVTAKPDVDDIHDSPALDVIERLLRLGAQVSYHDPYVAHLTVQNEQTLESVELSDALLRSLDCLVIVTDHSVFDGRRIVDQARLVVDCRNALAKVTGQARVVSL